MNWRRGVLLAGVNLAVAVPLIVMLEVRDEAFLREHQAPPARATDEPAPEVTPSNGEEQTVSFNPCSLWDHNAPEQEIAQYANLPAMALSGWKQFCPPRWSLAGRLSVGYSWSRSTIPSNRKVCWGFGLLIAIQWLLVGGFPLIDPRRWWSEPGAFITCCVVIAFVFVLIRPVDELARLPVLLAMLAWLWWFGLLIWKGARSGWRFIAGRSGQLLQG